MALTWPYADPHFAAYMFTVAATAAYGQNYWTRGGNTASTQSYSPSVAPYVMRAMGGTTGGPSSSPVLSTAVFSPPVRSTDAMTNIGSSSGCCESVFCRGCPSSLSSPPRLQPPSPATSSSSPVATTPTTFSPTTVSSKPLFQPYKNDVMKYK